MNQQYNSQLSKIEILELVVIEISLFMLLSCAVHPFKEVQISGVFCLLHAFLHKVDVTKHNICGNP